MIFDTHCHLDSADFDEDREQILNDMGMIVSLFISDFNLFFIFLHFVA